MPTDRTLQMRTMQMALIKVCCIELSVQHTHHIESKQRVLCLRSEVEVCLKVPYSCAMYLLLVLHKRTLSQQFPQRGMSTCGLVILRQICILFVNKLFQFTQPADGQELIQCFE